MNQLLAALKQLNAVPVEIPDHLVARFIRALPTAGEYKTRFAEATASGRSFAAQRKYDPIRTQATVELRQDLELERILTDVHSQQELLKPHGLYEVLPSEARNLNLKTLRKLLS